VHRWSGLGRKALHLLQKDLPPTDAMQQCITEICDAAKAKGARFLPGAEEESTGVNSGIDSWTIDLMRRYNKNEAFMYNTYQCYLRSTPERIVSLLAAASQEGFVPGIKTVRGAYLLSEPKSAVRQSFEETNLWYDGIVEALLKRQWNPYLPSPTGSGAAPFPKFALMLATHNARSIKKVQALRDEQVRNGEERVELAYAQLQGMAEHANEASDPPRPFKTATWGSVMECMNFLLRRAFENQDAMGRTVETRKAMGRELKRRMLHTVGLG
jgi:proline dehydrogenase